MTAEVARRPLEPLTLSMSAQQARTLADAPLPAATSIAPAAQRRTAQQAFGGDNNGDGRSGAREESPAKRARLDDRGPKAAGAAAGRKAAAKTKACKSCGHDLLLTAAYDESADGFQFSRAKSKKAKAVEPPVEVVENGAAATQPKRRQSRRQSGPAEPDETKPRRRSARISAGKDAEAQPSEPKTQARAPSREPDAVQETVRLAQVPKTPTVRVDKRRDNAGTVATKIALPFADTPVIVRNKEMRKSSALHAEGRRRSSLGLRGQRASSLIDSGTSNGEPDPDRTQPSPRARVQVPTTPTKLLALPHSQVATADFYKHIHQDLPEPRRMKQLLVWCGTRALPERPSGDASGAQLSSLLAARTIQEELLRDFAGRNEMSDWFARDDAAPKAAALVKKPNPRNIQNAAKLAELEAEVQRLQAEKTQWTELQRSLAAAPAQLPAPPPTVARPDPAAIDSALLDPAQAAILSSLLASRSHASDTAAALASAVDSLEFHVDALAEGAHRAAHVQRDVDAAVAAVHAQAAAVLSAQDAAGAAAAGTERVGLRDLMARLARTG